MCWKVQVRFLGGKGATRAPYLSDQQAVSKMEQSEVIEDDTLERVAKVLGVSSDAIKNFSEEAMFNNINNIFHDHSTLNNSNYQCTFNPIDKIVELYNEKVQLLERLLQSEKEKVELLKGQKKD